MHVSHMQMHFVMLCVLSVFRKGTIWRKNPPGNVDFLQAQGSWQGFGGEGGVGMRGRFTEVFLL